MCKGVFIIRGSSVEYILIHTDQEMLSIIPMKTFSLLISCSHSGMATNHSHSGMATNHRRSLLCV